MTQKKPSAPVKSSTQNFVEIEGVKDDILMLKDMSCCTIIESGAVNFGLLAEEEQQATIYSYGSLLSSLSFAVQIVILSKKWIFRRILIILMTKSKLKPMLF